MQTCPLCHNVLVSPLCCAHYHQQVVPLRFSIKTGPGNSNSSFHQPALPSMQIEPKCQTLESCVKSSDKNSMCQRQMPLSTPHISGHMFQFPSVNEMLVSPLHACQITCHVNCKTHGTIQYIPPSWPDSFQCNRHPKVQTLNLPIHYGDEDAHRVELTKCNLNQSGWYWAKLTWQEAEVLLQPMSVGTFLVRDSADPNHRFSLSVQTEKGPTSVRIQFSSGKFRLRCEESMKTALPEFSCVIKLIEHYVSTNERHNNHVWVDSAGKIYSPIRICRPLRKKLPSLLHLSRLAVNCIQPHSITSQRLPPFLAKYLDEYPFWC